MAEYYHIYDYSQIPITFLSILVRGLREDSRIYRRQTKTNLSVSNMLLAGINDRLSLILYSKTKDAINGVNRPSLILESLEEDNYKAFNSKDDFMKEREKFLEKKGGK
ncbi:MAG: DUF5361 domain-containing protein [Bacteroidaceae bacterium]|nr:DUF5361 domain-containing protein [Bacteroidaceae bacterium]